MKPANFLLRVESESTSSTSGASAPSPSAAAACTNSKINSASASASAGVAGEVDSAAAVSAALRLGVVAIDYGDHFDLAALSRDVDHYAQQCSTTSASFKQPGERVMQFLRGCSPSFAVSRLANADAHSAHIIGSGAAVDDTHSLTYSLCTSVFRALCRVRWMQDPLAFRMQRLLTKFCVQLLHLETLEGRLRAQSQWPDDADRADSEGDRDPCADSGGESDSRSDADSVGHSAADSDDDRSDSGSVADADPTADADADADLHGDSDADAEPKVDPDWDAGLADVSIASDDLVSDDGVDDDDGSITAEWIRLHRAKVLSRVTSSLESMRSFGQVIAVTSALKFVHSQGEHSGNGRMA